MSDTVIDPTFEPPAEAMAFFGEALHLLKESGIPFVLSGTYAVTAYTGISRPTKDLDVFCKAGDYPRILAYFQARGYRAEVEDERWIAKVKKGRHTFDVIFNSRTAATPITDSWFAEKHTTKIYGIEVQEAHVQVTYSLTTPGCPLHASIEADVKHVLGQVPGVDDVSVELVWDPPWTPDAMSDSAKSALGFW